MKSTTLPRVPDDEPSAPLSMSANQTTEIVSAARELFNEVAHFASFLQTLLNESTESTRTAEIFTAAAQLAGCIGALADAASVPEETGHLQDIGGRWLFSPVACDALLVLRGAGKVDGQCHAAENGEGASLTTRSHAKATGEDGRPHTLQLDALDGFEREAVIRSIRRALVIGLQSYAELDRLCDAAAACTGSGASRLPKELHPVHPTAAADTAGKFADALRWVDALEGAPP